MSMESWKGYYKSVSGNVFLFGSRGTVRSGCFEVHFMAYPEEREKSAPLLLLLSLAEINVFGHLNATTNSEGTLAH
ncbi:hypothetical protein CEXT_29721 [Caerostris extrusa]|uniref:Uncharacterized protein n=1 Tax=Caerostris extrusa TaxID=172846 RepID=A0AAV4U5U0_CAEEX|nr:hypothetical protein CEXT_29721 [Caerostris extrusa]